MAVLDRILIRGIRSFGPENDEKVKFSTPLTLLLGQNGCGKTTIIECIKYALTRELPAGTDSGRGFINDPKMSNKSTTKASIKLRFKDHEDNYITVGKFMELTTKAGGKLQFKCLDPSIRTEDRNGRICDIDGRCVDADLYCAQKLNVSKAILNNVIFCHQENASWPLDEAKKLKDKFDEIFGSTEYSKCIEKIRKLIKEKKTNIRVLKEQVIQKEMDKKSTEQLRDSVNEREVQLDIIQKAIEQQEKELEPLRKKLEDINGIVDTLSVTRQKMTSLDTRRKAILEQQETLKKHLVEEYAGTDEQLEQEISNFDSVQLKIKKDIQEREKKRIEIDTKVDEINQVVQKHQVQYGQLKQEETEHQKRCKEFEQLIEKVTIKYGIPKEEDDSTNDIIHKLKVALKGQELVFENHQKNMEINEQKLQNVIDNVRSKLAAGEESFSSTNKQVIEINGKVNEAKVKLSRLTHSNIQLASIQKKLMDAEQNLQKKKAGFDEGQELNSLEELVAEINKMELNLNKLDREFRVLQQNYVTEQNIESEKMRFYAKKGEMSDLLLKHEQNFEALFGDAVPEEKFEESVKTIQEKEESKVKSLANNVSSLEKKIISLEAGVKHLSDKLQSHKDELKQDKSRIESVCKGKDFNQVLNETYTKKEKLQKDRGAYRSAKTLFEQFINQFQQQEPCCPVCSTDFSSKKSVVPSIINTLKRKIEDLPRKLEETDIQLKKEEEFYNKLQQLKPLSQNIQVFEGVKIPLLEEQLQNETEKLEDYRLELASIKHELINPQNLVETCQKVVFDAALLDRLNREKTYSQQVIERLNGELVTVPSNRTLTETETELSKVKAEINNLRMQHKTKRDLFDEMKQSIHSLNEKVQHETQKNLEIQKQLQEMPLIEKQINEYKTALGQLDKNKKELAQKVTALKIELAEAQNKKQTEVAKSKALLEQNRTDLGTCKKFTEEVIKLNAIIEQYREKGFHGKMENVLRDLDTCKKNIAKLEEAKKVLNQSVVKSKEELASQESRLRALSDNKELRRSRIKSRELENEIRQLQQQIGHHNSQSIIDERRKVMGQIDKMQAEISRRLGEQDKLQEFIKQGKDDLGTKQHKESSTQYKRKYCEWKVEEAAKKDLEDYVGMLEVSVLKFHKEHMVRINITIRELWRSIYKGNDIDYIEIKTVDDIGSAASKRRSYNYKVVQVKKGTELDMRGRCSAGQKVLACLVIRMALAETFSANCGILALDEPTTNLDRDNIMSLCDALSRIITAREKQKNFQLIIITHDEEFLKTLTRDQSSSNYFKVQRNADGFSVVTEEVL